MPKVSTPPAASSATGVFPGRRKIRSPPSIPLPIARTGCGSHSGSPAIQSNKYAATRTLRLLIPPHLYLGVQTYLPKGADHKRDQPIRRLPACRAHSRPRERVDLMTLLEVASMD